jgi:hypothetical protein
VDQGGQIGANGLATQGKGRRQLAWEKFMLRMLSLEPGMYTISLAIDDKEGFLVGSIENRGKVERWG